MRKLVALALIMSTSILFGQTYRFLEVGKDRITNDAYGSARDFLIKNPDLTNGNGREDYEPISLIKDKMGFTHARFQILLDGRIVEDSHMVVHANEDSVIYAITGQVPGDDTGQEVASLTSDAAMSRTLEEIGMVGADREKKPKLVYVLNEKGNAELAWRDEIKYEGEEGPMRDVIFAGAVDGHHVATHPQHIHAKNRNTYSAGGATGLPGGLVRNEGSAPTGDSCLNAAHDFAGITYDYYWNVHLRDSWDGAGAPLNSTVHYSTNYNNAFWNGSQMVYGDGDGSTFICLALDLDVVVHEITHGVTSTTPGLIYSGQTRAISEHYSDVFAAAADVYANGAVSASTWMIGDVVYTPATSGDALRYLDDPTLDGVSTAYYPALTGVGHYDASVGNLAFYLLSQGGTHPSGATTIPVSGIGINKAADIWYRAMILYLPTNATYPNLAAATLQAAQDLYGPFSNEFNQVSNAWAAVGVCTNGNMFYIAWNQSGSTGQWSYWLVPVPANTCSLRILTALGWGNLDLYTRFGAPPSFTSNACASTGLTNLETCTHTGPSGGWWWAGLFGTSSYGGAAVVFSY